MKRCCYLSMNDLSAFVSDADLSVPPMRSLGWDVETVSWRAEAVNWDRFDLVYIATPWDYQDAPDAFIAVLEDIDRSQALLLNPLSIVRWNLDKRYLAELEQDGVAIVPSLWFDRWDERALPHAFREFDTDKLVIKPQVGANADLTWIVDAGGPADGNAVLSEAFARRAYFVQPFVEAIRTDGELSLFFFGGSYSHAIRKRPKAGDFRSQEEHGADIRFAETDAALQALARSALARLPEQPAYARVDYVLGNDGRYWLMELELIEPSLYFRVDPESALRFARALDAAYGGSGST